MTTPNSTAATPNRDPNTPDPNAAILTAAPEATAAWNSAIKTLLDSGQIERQGERRGAKYRRCAD
jgi:hypothetical protein